MRFLPLCAVVLSHSVGALPYDHTGLMVPSEDRASIMDDLGEVNLHDVVDQDNELDSNSYAGEDEKMEKANDQVLHFKQGGRKLKIHKSLLTRSLHRNDDLWRGGAEAEDGAQAHTNLLQRGGGGGAFAAGGGAVAAGVRQMAKGSSGKRFVQEQAAGARAATNSFLEESFASSRGNLPHDEGMMLPRGEDSGSMMDDEGVVNLHAIVDEDDEPDTNAYPGEDEQMEKANDQVLHFKNAGRKLHIAPGSAENYSVDDLWGNQ